MKLTVRDYVYLIKVRLLVAAKFLVVLPVLPILLLLYLLEPVWRIRICNVGSVRRIGVLTVVPDYYLRLWRRAGFPKRTSFVFIMHSPDNRPLMEAYRRLVTIWESRAVNWILEAMDPVFRRTRFSDTRWLEYHSPKFYGPDVFLSFTKTEQVKGEEFLRGLGIGPSDWFVCFHAREPEYYEKINVPKFEKRIHAARNSDPNSYLGAANVIAERGGFAIRMGAGVAKCLPAERSSKILDYAFERHDPFADIYLSARCKFFLGNTAGIVAVPSVFRKPVALANMMPPSGSPLGSDDPWVPMLARHVPSGKILSFEELWELGLFDNALTSEVIARIVALQKLEWVPNTSEEISDLCMDAFDIIEGRSAPAGARELQEYFRSRFHGHFEDWESRPLLSARFAMRHASLILAQ